MPKQLSRCCKAEIELTWEDRPNHFKCGECSRIIWEPYEDEVVNVATEKRRNIVDNQTARHESYSPHLIRSTATDTNVGSKTDPLDQVDRALVTEWFKRWVKHAVEEFEKLRENKPNQTHWMIYNERSENMQDIYLYNDIPWAN